MTEEKEMNKHQRYYALHREQKLSKYHSDPDVIAKREERARKKAEKERKRQETLQLALATKKINKQSNDALHDFLAEIPPVVK